MGKRVSAGIVTLLVVVAVVAGGVIGFFVLRDDPLKTSTEDRIDYGCEVALGMADVTVNGPDVEHNRAVSDDIFLISSLFGGTTGFREGESSEAEEYGFMLFRAYSILDTEQVEETFDDILDYCTARM